MEELLQQIEKNLLESMDDVVSLRILNFANIAGGYSEETFRCDLEIKHSDKSEETLPVIIRRDPVTEADILPTSRKQEFTLIQNVQEKTNIPVPTPYLLDADGSKFGRPTMMMERCVGDSDITLLTAPGRENELETIATELCEHLAKLHTTDRTILDPDETLSDPRSVGVDVTSWENYMETSINYFLANYQKIAFDPMPVWFDMFNSLKYQLPKPTSLVVCHGDFQPSNFLFENGKITGIIDWENAHIGDPREEIGWVVHLSALSGIDILSAVKKDGGFLQYYSNLTGIEVTEEDVGFFRMFSCSSLATPILDAVRRRLSGESSLFTHLYLLQPLVMSNPVYAAVLGYPASSESP